jgi:hypothetical protein
MILLPLIILSMTTVLISSLITIPSADADNNKHLKGRSIPIPDNPLTPPNQSPVTSLSRNRIASGLELPKNLIVPTCPGASSTSSSGSNTCPPVIGTNQADIIIATEVPGATIYALEGNDVIQCGPGDCIVYSGPGDNIMMSSSSNTAKLFGGSK